MQSKKKFITMGLSDFWICCFLCLIENFYTKRILNIDVQLLKYNLFLPVTLIFYFLITIIFITQTKWHITKVVCILLKLTKISMSETIKRILYGQPIIWVILWFLWGCRGLWYLGRRKDILGRLLEMFCIEWIIYLTFN